MLKQKQLLTRLFEFAAGAPLARVGGSGFYKDMHGNPILRCYGFPPVRPATEEYVRKATRRWLYWAATDLDLMEARLSAVGVPCETVTGIRTVRGGRSRPQADAGWMIPTVRNPGHWPLAIMMLALITPVGEHDCLANRVGYCEICRKFFLRGVSVPSTTCSRECWRIKKKLTDAGVTAGQATAK